MSLLQKIAVNLRKKQKNQFRYFLILSANRNKNFSNGNFNWLNDYNYVRAVRIRQ